MKKIHWIRNHSNGGGNESDDSESTVVEEPLQSAASSRESSCEKHFPGCNAEVICENGKRFYADYVICTVPLGVLKEKSDELFQPQLPECKTEALSRLLFGTVDKIYLEFERPFLHPSITEVMLLWDDESPKGGDRDLSNTWYKKIYSFTKISETLLLGWISGQEAEYMEQLPSEVVINKCTEILRRFLNDPYIPKPKSCVW